MHRDPYLVPPRKRKNNRFFIIRGTFDGKPDNEKSTGTADEDLANRMLARLIYNEKCNIQAREFKTFNFAADHYIAWRNSSKRELGFIDKMRPHIGNMPINEITQSDIVALANLLHPKGKGTTKNRAVVRPISAIMRYAAKPTHKWCDLCQIEAFKEQPVMKRAIPVEDAIRLVNETKGMQRLFLLWLFKHSDRVTATLQVEGKNIHIDQGYYDRLTGKSVKRWVKAPLDLEVVNALKDEYGLELPQGRIFSWGDRHNVYRWIKPLSKRINIAFTPHVARHSILSWIADAGGSSSQIKTRAGHASLKSSEPYLAENLNVTRDITAKFSLVKKKHIRLESRGTPRGKSDRKCNNDE